VDLLDPTMPVTVIVAEEDNVNPNYDNDGQPLNGVYFFEMVPSDFAQLIILKSGSTPQDQAGHDTFHAINPRGLDALDLWGHIKIVAGVGLSSQAIGQDVFGVSILMTLLTTMIAPPLLVRSFRGESGLKENVQEAEEQEETFALEFPSPDIAEFLLQRLVRAFQHEEFFVNRLHLEMEAYQVRKDELSFTLMRKEGEISISVPSDQQHIARLMVFEELLSLSDLLEASKNMKSLDVMGSELIGNLF